MAGNICEEEQCAHRNNKSYDRCGTCAGLYGQPLTTETDNGAEVTLDCGVSFAVVLWRNEDELPEEMTDEEYNYLFDSSKVDMVRLFPYVVIDGKEHYLMMQN